MNTLGIILAGGKSTRLYPATLGITKQFLPVYDKPLIYYPISTLMLAGIDDILIITNPSELELFEWVIQQSKLKEMGVNISFAKQENPNGLPEAFTIAEKHKDISSYGRTCLILGDNIFYGAGLSGMLHFANRPSRAATVFLQRVVDPTRFGVPIFDDNGKIVGLEEKPKNPQNNFAVTGLYFFPQNVYEYTKNLKYSARGELEITDLLKNYLNSDFLDSVKMSRGMSWFDTGTADSLLESAWFVKTIQDHQGYLVGSVHEIAFNNGWVDATGIRNFVSGWGEKTAYGRYLMDMVK